MEVICTTKGQFIIDSDRDLVDALEIIGGNEIANMVGRKLDLKTEAEYYAEKALQSDLQYYETELGHDTTRFMDIAEICEELIDTYFAAPRLNRDILKMKIQEIKKLASQ